MRRILPCLLLTVAIIAGAPTPQARAQEIKEITLAQQFGAIFIPLMAMENLQLIEKQADPSAVWPRPSDPHTEWGAGEVKAEELKGSLLRRSGGRPYGATGKRDFVGRVLAGVCVATACQVPASRGARRPAAVAAHSPPAHSVRRSRPSQC